MLSDEIIRDAGLSDLAARALAGEPLGEDDLSLLLHSREVHALRELADRVRRRAHGDAVQAVQAVPVHMLVAQVTPTALVELRAARPDAVLVCDPAHERTALEFLRACACVRLAIEPAAHVAASGAELGPSLAQIAPGWGVDQILVALPAEVAA